MSANRWEEIQNVRDSRANLRSKHAQRKQELQKILQNTAANATDATTVQKVPESAPLSQKQNSPMKTDTIPLKIASELPTSKADPKLSSDDQKAIENCILSELDSQDLAFPIDGLTLSEKVLQETKIPHTIDFIRDILLKFESKYIIVTEQKKSEVIKVMSANHDMISQIVDANGVKRKRTPTESSDSVEKKKPKTDDRLNIETLLASETARERETKKMNEEVQELLNMASTKELILSSKFKSQGGTMKQFCLYGTRAQCRLTKGPGCDKVHFRRLIHQHTDITLGDCSFLNTCFHMDTCKYVHYEVDQDDLNRIKRDNMSAAVSSLKKSSRSDFKMMSPQWIQCDLRKFDMTVLGKFAVIMADPPWDIHMELPYGTMSDDEMRSLNIPCLQDDGFIFLWVTGRAMELGRECLETWGYRRCDELIWVKTNQLQKLIRTGRTGHWLNHGKEHCLIGVKGNPHHMNRGLDCDVIVAEVRATSHKPDEIYGIIERLSPGTRKIELFGRPHNVQPNWVTLGNQLDGVQLHEEEVKRSFKKRYPDGKCI